MYHCIKNKDTHKGFMSPYIQSIVTWFQVYQDRKNVKHTLHKHYRCKINNQKALIRFNPQAMAIEYKNQVQDIPYAHIRDVSIKTKWWSIRVTLKTKKAIFYFDLDREYKAHQLYEELIYKKVENRL